MKREKSFHSPPPPLFSFKRDKNIGYFLVRSVLKSDDQRGSFKWACKRCNTCPFIHNADKITGSKRSIKIPDRFTRTSANVIYYITCSLCKKIYIGETGRRLGNRSCEHLRDVERNHVHKDACKPFQPTHDDLLPFQSYTRVTGKAVKI